MFDTILTVDEPFMEGIEEQYSEAEIIIEEILENLRGAQEIINECYTGLADEINNGGMERYIQHVEFLGLCCRATREYVVYSKEFLLFQDRLIKQTMVAY